MARSVVVTGAFRQVRTVQTAEPWHVTDSPTVAAKLCLPGILHDGVALLTLIERFEANYRSFLHLSSRALVRGCNGWSRASLLHWGFKILGRVRSSWLNFDSK